MVQAEPKKSAWTLIRKDKVSIERWNIALEARGLDFWVLSKLNDEEDGSTIRTWLDQMLRQGGVCYYLMGKYTHISLHFPTTWKGGKGLQVWRIRRNGIYKSTSLLAITSTSKGNKVVSRRSENFTLDLVAFLNLPQRNLFFPSQKAMNIFHFSTAYVVSTKGTQYPYWNRLMDRCFHRAFWKLLWMCPREIYNLAW